MAFVQNKRLLLVALFIFCFISSQARARTLKETSDVASRGASNTARKEAYENTFKTKEDEVNHEDQFSMDYTPASKKPPIHN